MKVVFLCHGNVNRSAAGEIILRTMKPDWEIKSGGLGKDAGGQITAKKMRTALEAKGFPSEGIRSTKCTRELIDWADIVFYMDTPNEKKLEDQFGPDVFPKCQRISNLININKIPDPAFAKGTTMHEHVIDLLTLALRNYLNGLPAA